MNTPAHLIFGAAAFGRPGDRRVTLAALAGGLAPDVSLYLMAGTALILGHAPAQVFGTFYHSDAWQQVFAVDNSFVLWGLAAAVAVGARSGWAVAFTGAALLHLAFDFPLHADDARMHFWPLSDWVFRSPVSYWDGARGGGWVGPVEQAATLGITILLLVRFRSLAWRAVFAGIAVLELAPLILWGLIF